MESIRWSRTKKRTVGTRPTTRDTTVENAAPAIQNIPANTTAETIHATAIIVVLLPVFDTVPVGFRRIRRAILPFPPISKRLQAEETGCRGAARTADTFTVCPNERIERSRPAFRAIFLLPSRATPAAAPSGRETMRSVHMRTPRTWHPVIDASALDLILA